MNSGECRSRHELLETFGNLTILTESVNCSISNRPCKDKRPAWLSASLLPINQQLHDADVWDEEAIERRSEELLGRAVQVWPGPD